MSATLTAVDDTDQEQDETVTVSAAHNGSTVGTATVTIAANDVPLSTDATLSALTLSGIDIATFAPATTGYTATVSEAVSSTTVTATPTDAGASVTIADANGSTAGGSRAVSLSYGANTITITVAAADGQTTATYTVTVTRAYSPPMASIAAGTTPVTEGTAAVFTVSLDKPAPLALTVAVSVTESGAMLAANPPASVTFGAGKSSATLTVATNDDAVVEGASAVTAAIGSGEDYSAAAGAGSAQVSVEDDDAPSWSVSPDAVEIVEGGSTAVTVAIANGLTFAADQTITLSASGTAVAADYTLDPTTLTLSAGATAVSATLTAVDDEAEEQDETVTVSAAHNGSTAGAATVTIAANDAALSNVATLSALTLSGIDIGTFAPATTAYTATVAEAVSSTTVTATPTDAGASVTITDTNGSTAGGSRAVSLSYGANTITVAVTAAAGQTTATYTVTVTRAQPTPTFTVTAGQSTIAEGGSTAVTVEIANGVTFAADQTITLTASGTAAAADYTLAPTTLTLNAGTTEVSATLTAVDDEAEEQDEAVTVSAVHNGSTVGTATVTIAANDVALSADATLSALTLSGIDIGTFAPATTAYTASVAEAVSSTTVTATPNDADASVTISDSDGSTTGGSRAVSLAYGANTITATVTAADGQTTATYTVTVTRAQPPLTASFHDVPKTHDGETEFTFELRFSEELELSYLTLRDEEAFAVTGGRVLRARRIVPGSNRRWTMAFLPETRTDVVATLRGGRPCAETGAICASGERQLANSPSARVAGPDSVAPAVSIAADAATVSQGAAAAFTLTRTGDVQNALTVTVFVSESGAMAAGNPPGSATFAAGEITAALVVPTSDDAVVEADSTVMAALAAGEGYSVGMHDSASVVVEDDDAAMFTVTARQARIKEGDGTAVTVAIANGVTFAADQTITLSVLDAAVAADYTLDPTTLTLSAGANEVSATLTAVDDEGQKDDETVTVWATHEGSSVGTATVTIAATAESPAWGERLPEKDVDLSAANPPRGLFSDGETLWTADRNNGRVVAYVLADGSRAASRDFALGSYLPTALFSDGATLWVADAGGVYTYRLADGERLADDDLDAEVMADAGNDRPAGLWSDGDTMWVADHDSGHVYAYAVADGSRQSGREFSLRRDDLESMKPFGLWSDGATVLATDGARCAATRWPTGCGGAGTTSTRRRRRTTTRLGRGRTARRCGWWTSSSRRRTRTQRRGCRRRRSPEAC